MKYFRIVVTISGMLKQYQLPISRDTV